jgi:hypothetical protein
MFISKLWFLLVCQSSMNGWQLCVGTGGWVAVAAGALCLSGVEGLVSIYQMNCDSSPKAIEF